MNLIEIADGSVQLLKKHSPKILLFTGIGLGVGAVGLSGVASFKAAEIVEDIHRDPMCDDKKYAAKQYLKRIIPLYIPVAIAETGSIICLVKSYDINAKRLAAATALAEVSMETLRIYKEKAKKVIGEEKAKQLEDEVREEQRQNDEKKAISGDPCSEIQWFKDEVTGQEFLSTRENILRAQCELVNKLHCEFKVSFNEFIDILNEYSFRCDGSNEYQLEQVLNGNQIGWEEGGEINISFEPSTLKNGKSCLKLCYNLPPRAGFRHRYY